MRGTERVTLARTSPLNEIRFWQKLSILCMHVRAEICIPFVGRTLWALRVMMAFNLVIQQSIATSLGPCNF